MSSSFDAEQLPCLLVIKFLLRAIDLGDGDSKPVRVK
jgi:hypothetical protein